MEAPHAERKEQTETGTQMQAAGEIKVQHALDGITRSPTGHTSYGSCSLPGSPRRRHADSDEEPNWYDAHLYTNDSSGQGTKRINRGGAIGDTT